MSLRKLLPNTNQWGTEGAELVDTGKLLAMPQRDNVIEEIKRLDLLLEYAVQHGDEAEAERLREELKRLTDSI